MAKLKIKTLDEIVLAALDRFGRQKPATLELTDFTCPFVVGSGNAYCTGKIICSRQAAIFASESDFKESLVRYRPLIDKKIISQALVISASGEKDSVWEIEAAQQAGLKTTLLTCSASSPAAQQAEQVLTYHKLPEPYTYNTSTYLGMILGATGEKAENIKQFIKKLHLPKKFKQYRAYSFILPDELAELAPMLDTKRHELFGPKLSLRAFSFGEARHAKFVIRDKKELVISFGINKYFGDPENRWEIKAPENFQAGAAMAICYYLIGLIQKSKPDYFKKNITRFCLDDGPKAYGSNQPFDIIVPSD